MQNLDNTDIRAAMEFDATILYGAGAAQRRVPFERRCIGGIMCCTSLLLRAIVIGVLMWHVRADAADPTRKPRLSYSDVWKNLMPSVATLTGFQKTRITGVATAQVSSGFVINPQKRLILTNCRILFGDLRTLGITVQFPRPSAERSAELVTCDHDLDVAIVRVRESAPDLPPPILPAAPDEQLFGEGLYILGFVSIPPVVVPASVEQRDAVIPGISGTFIRTRSTLPPSTPSAKNIEDMLGDMSDLIAGPLINANGKFVGVNMFSSLGSINKPRSGVEVAKVPKSTYYARRIEDIGHFIREALGPAGGSDPKPQLDIERLKKLMEGK